MSAALVDQATGQAFAPAGRKATGATLVEVVAGGASVSAVATASAPAYAEGSTEPLSLDDNGNLRVKDAAALTALNALVAAATDTSDVNVKGPPAAVASVAPAVSISPAYSTGDCIGGMMTFAGMGRTGILSGIFESLTIQCKSAQSFAGELWVFNDNPTSSTITDNAAFVLAPADFDKVAFVVPITSANWYAGNVASVASIGGLAQQYLTAAGSLYAALIVRATPTLGSSTDIKVVAKAMLD
ncbi:MAG TPA: hypothetical protein VNW53_11700 [Phenylobacterium sp.]|jgi:hypothetical protein|uniref:hypothetical protein n=1 Tax=Phenylobacterium sp. TaxID=1871053 RepID=UPI002B5FEF3D|nr:hypothetical protein [Phenylobacterium sp.]HXA39657.1 hypothetical protein [Phenylobacterium sp.]